MHTHASEDKQTNILAHIDRGIYKSQEKHKTLILAHKHMYILRQIYTDRNTEIQTTTQGDNDVNKLIHTYKDISRDTHTQIYICTSTYTDI